MASALPDYYAVLGLPQSAPATAIKKRYRELARRYHPDVAQGAHAETKIRQINEAYRVLGDAEHRATYDAERTLAQRSFARASSHGAHTHAPPATGNGAAPKPAGSEQWDFDGFGRAARRAASDTAAAAQRRPARAGGTTAPGTRVVVERILADARLAFLWRQYATAEVGCRRALEIQPRSAPAQELLGDILAKRGDWLGAATAYSYAIQFDPSGHAVEEKLAALLCRHGGKPRRGPVVTHRDRATALSRWRFGEGTLVTASVPLLVLAVATPIALRMSPGPVWRLGVSVSFVLALAMEGLCAGVLLSLCGLVGPLAAESATNSASRARRSSSVLLPLLLSVAAVAWYGLSLLLYAGVSVARRRVSVSLARAYGVALALSITLGWTYAAALGTGLAWPPLLLSGNVLFPAALAGWALGDVARRAVGRGIG